MIGVAELAAAMQVPAHYLREGPLLSVAEVEQQKALFFQTLKLQRYQATFWRYLRRRAPRKLRRLLRRDARRVTRPSRGWARHVRQQKALAHG